MKGKLKNNNGITLIALVVTIVVLIILAGVSISMLTGENGIITQAQQSKLQTEIGKEKEYITLSVSSVKGDKISRGDTSEITSGELQTEMNKYTDEATVTGSGTLTVTYESGRSYDVEQDGSITEKEELTPEQAKKIVYATGCIGALLVETADGTVYLVDNLQTNIMQKIEITDAEIITTNGIREAGDNYFIDNEGKVYTWGNNSSGQLGNETWEDSNELICISDIEGNALNGKNIVEIRYDGYSIIIAIDSEGKVYTWGNNEYGQLGGGTTTNSNKPICISDILGNALNGKNIKKIQNSGSTIMAIDSEGKVYTWGRNSSGQLGEGTTTNSNVPICISDIPENALNGKNIVEIQSNGSTMIALDSEGKVYTWGGNSRGQLGNGTEAGYDIYNSQPQCISDIPENVLNGKNIQEVQSYSNTMIAIDNERKVYTWGYNFQGQLGNGTTKDSNEPICISDITWNVLNGKNIKEIKFYESSLIAIDSEGKIYTWGSGVNGIHGNGGSYVKGEPECISDMPENVLNGKIITEVQISNYAIIAIDTEGRVYTWGQNIFQLENETSRYIYLPISITNNEGNELYNKKIKIINISNSSFSYITEDGELYNYYLDLGPS